MLLLASGLDLKERSSCTTFLSCTLPSHTSSDAQLGLFSETGTYSIAQMASDPWRSSCLGLLGTVS